MSRLTRLGQSETVREGLRIIPKVVFIVVLLSFLIYAMPQVVGAEQSYVVLSGSMEPSLSSGDVILVYQTDPATIEEGDIITFRQEGADTPVTHRVVEVERGSDGTVFKTKGDANEDPDPSAVPASRVVGQVPQVSLPVVGQVPLHIPYIGYVVEFASTTHGIILMIFLPIALLIANEVWSIARMQRESDTTSATDPASLSPEPDIQEMTDISGLNETRADALNEAGFETVEDIRQADRPELTSVPGISTALAAHITAEAGPKSQDRSRPDAELPAGATSDVDGRSEGEQTYTISATDMRLTLGAMGLLAAYSAYIAYQTQSALSVSVAVAAIGCASLAAGIRYFAPSETVDIEPEAKSVQSSRDSVREPDQEASPIVVTGDPGPELDERPRILLDSFGELTKIARRNDQCIVRKPETGDHVVIAGGAVYTVSDVASHEVDAEASVTDLGSAPDQADDSTGSRSEPTSIRGDTETEVDVPEWRFVEPSEAGGNGSSGEDPDAEQTTEHSLDGTATDRNATVEGTDHAEGVE